MKLLSLLSFHFPFFKVIFARNEKKKNIPYTITSTSNFWQWILAEISTHYNLKILIFKHSSLSYRTFSIRNKIQWEIQFFRQQYCSWSAQVSQMKNNSLRWKQLYCFQIQAFSMSWSRDPPQNCWRCSGNIFKLLHGKAITMGFSCSLCLGSLEFQVMENWM